MACPALNDYTLPALKDKNISHHPWEKTIKAYYYNRIKRAHNTIRNPVYPEPTENKNKLNDRIKFTVIGIRLNKEFIYCANLVKGMHKYRSKTFDAPSIKGLFTTQWPFKQLTLNFGGSVYCLRTPVIVLKNGEFFGGDKELKEFIESRYIYRLCLDYRKEYMQDFYRYVKSAGRPFAYLEIAINEKPIGLLIFVLYPDVVPKTCENFLRLCNMRKKGYPGSPVHRIVKDGWIQCGGFFLEGSNLDCENFIVPYDRRGVLGMCNDGRGVDCSTQFFVLLQPTDWMAYKYVAFGQLVEGEEVLKQIENEPTFYESPASSIVIARAGILNLDCKDITIMKGAREYINKHIEDLIETQEFFWELLMQRLWAEIKARRKARIENQKSAHRESDIIPGSFGGDLIPIFENKENQESNEFAVESYFSSMGEMCEEYHISDEKMDPPGMKMSRPFYLPLTDVPYPDEKDSTFDLKRFLQGDYCLESDLDHHLNSHEKRKALMKINYSELPSDMLLFDKDDVASLNDDLEMSPSDEEEINRYYRQHVDRMSFAGNVIKTIGVEGRGQGLPSIFEGVRNHISLLARRQSKRSVVPHFTDEDLRKLRLAAIRESDIRQQPTSKEELPQLVGSGTDAVGRANLTEREWERLKRAIEATNKSSSEKKKNPEFDKRRYSVVDPDTLKSTTGIEVEDLTDEQRDKIRKISIFDEQISRKLLEEDPSELDEIKQRQAVFAKDTARVESFEKDIPSEEASGSSIESVDLEKARTQETSNKSKVQIKETDEVVKLKKSSFHRRPTGFVRGMPDDDEDDDGDTREKKCQAFIKNFVKAAPTPTVRLRKISENNKKGSTISFEEEYEIYGEKETKSASELDKIKRRQMVFAKDLARVKSYQKDFLSREPSIESIESVDLVKSKKQETRSKVTIDEPEKTKESTFHRRPTAFVQDDDVSDDDDEDDHKDDDEDEDDHKIKHHESTFLKNVEKSYFDKDAPLPTLKNYRPHSETIPTSKNMFLTKGNVLHAEPDDAKELLRHHRSEFMNISDSLLRMPRLSFGKKAEAKISSEYVVTLHELERHHTHTPMGRVRHTRRPLITVEEYRKMNEERLEKMKKEEEESKETRENKKLPLRALFKRK